MDSRLNYPNYHQDPLAWAKKLKISAEAVQLYLASEVVDLHTDSFIWQRVFGYQMGKHHRPLPWGNIFWGQVDFPRCREAQMAGIVWDIPTNPLQSPARRYGILRKNISLILAELKKYSADFQHVVSYQDYQRARAAGKIASWISIQGGQSIDANLHYLDRIPEVHRITLVHFTQSRIGASNFDSLHKQAPLSAFGRAFVEKMVANKILVDLSHINRQGFFDALDVMPADIPPIVTHTGVKGVHDIWRNIDDAQILAIAERQGTIGVIYEKRFLAAQNASMNTIVDHMAHIIQVAGDDFVSLGSDYDGLITLPDDFIDITWQPVLVQRMLERHWSVERIQKILAQNFLRVVKQVRPI